MAQILTSNCEALNSNSSTIKKRKIEKKKKGNFLMEQARIV
jgi:hypothetical protein